MTRCHVKGTKIASSLSHSDVAPSVWLRGIGGLPTIYALWGAFYQVHKYIYYYIIPQYECQVVYTE